MTRSVADAAAVLSVIAGPDTKDKITLSQPTVIPGYTNALDVNYLKGKRIGVPRQEFLDTKVPGRVYPIILEAFEKALDTMKGLGAIIVDPADFPSAGDLADSVKVTETIVLNGDFKVITDQRITPFH
jgi:amidase